MRIKIPALLERMPTERPYARLGASSIALFFILGIGLLLRAYKIDTLPLNHDEANTTLRTIFLLKSNDFVSYAGLPIAFFDGKIPALFSSFVAISFRWFDKPEIIVRLPSIVFGVLTILLTYRLAKELLGRKIALVSAFLLAILPWHIVQSRVGVSAILTPFFGVFFFLLFVKAIKKQSYKYFYLSCFVLGISAFWSYTASQVFVILAVICYIVFARELKWLKPIDILSSILLFIIPLYPFLANWDKSDFIRSQYYYSIFAGRENSSIPFLNNAVYRLKDALSLLFFAKSPFALFAPGLKGPVIQYFLLLPLALGILHIRKDSLTARIAGIWLIGGIFFSVCFIRQVEDRYFIAIAPLLSILIAAGIFFKKGRKIIFFSASAAMIGAAIYLLSYLSYLYRAPLESLKVYSYGSSQTAEFLLHDPDFLKPQARAVIEWRMSPVIFYFLFSQEKDKKSLDYSSINKFAAITGNIQRFADAGIYCLWSPETRHSDWDAFNCQLYKEFRLLHPRESPAKIVYYPDGRKAIEIFKILK